MFGKKTVQRTFRFFSTTTQPKNNLEASGKIDSSIMNLHGLSKKMDAVRSL